MRWRIWWIRDPGWIAPDGRHGCWRSRACWAAGRWPGRLWRPGGGGCCRSWFCRRWCSAWAMPGKVGADPGGRRPCARVRSFSMSGCSDWPWFRGASMGAAIRPATWCPPSGSGRSSPSIFPSGPGGPTQGRPGLVRAPIHAECPNPLVFFPKSRKRIPLLSRKPVPFPRARRCVNRIGHNPTGVTGLA